MSRRLLSFMKELIGCDLNLTGFSVFFLSRSLPFGGTG